MLKKIMKKGKNNKGFTLVELLVVIAIIAILAVVAVPSLMKNINKAKVADIVADYSAIKSQVLSTYADDTLLNGTYTKTTTGTTLVITKENTNQGTETIEVNDLSKEAAYSLAITNDANKGTQKAELTITVKNTDIASKVSDQINGTLNDKVIKVEILK